jgi:predicted RNase H-like nuclease
MFDMKRHALHTRVAGVDGCRGGWLVVEKALGAPAIQVALLQSVRDLDPDLAMVAIDIPIGLSDSGARACDVEARSLLEARRKSSVFPPPRRPMLQFERYEDANAWGRAQGPGGGLSVQAWNITPRIRDVDAFVTPERQNWIRESHPELAFRALNGGNSPAPKRTPAGKAERHALLKSEGLTGMDAALAAVPRAAAGADDFYDAAVLALVAERMVLGQAQRLPADPPRDARGLRMEVWH